MAKKKWDAFKDTSIDELVAYILLGAMASIGMWMMVDPAKVWIVEKIVSYGFSPWTSFPAGAIIVATSVFLGFKIKKYRAGVT